MTDSELVYRVSMGYEPRLMARKQIIQLGIKCLDPLEIIANNYSIKRKKNVEQRPFEFRVLQEFNLLPLATRKLIIDNLDPLDKSKMNKIKSHLKDYYIKLYNPNG